MQAPRPSRAQEKMTKSIYEGSETTALSSLGLGISSCLERLSIEDHSQYNRPSAEFGDRVYFYQQSDRRDTPSKPPPSYSFIGHKLSLGAPLFEAWLTSSSSSDPWNPLEAAWDQYRNESKNPPKSSVRDYIDPESTWRGSVKCLSCSSTGAVTGGAIHLGHHHINEGISIHETTRIGANRPPRLLGSKYQGEHHIEALDRPSRGSRLPRFKFTKSANTETALNIPPIPPKSQSLIGVKIKEEVKDDSNTCTPNNNTTCVCSDRLGLMEKPSLEMDGCGNPEGWHYLSGIGSTETDSEFGPEMCGVGDDIVHTLPNKLLAQTFFDEALSDSGSRTHPSGRKGKGKGVVPQAKSGESSRLAHSYYKSSGSNVKRRRCLNSEDGNEEEDEDNTRGGKNETLQIIRPPQLCPVFVADPSHADFLPGGKWFKSCTKHVPKIPQHMNRYHFRSEQCNNCGFRGDAGQVKDHKETSTCKKKPFEPVSAGDKGKADRLKRKRGPPWSEVFEIQMGSNVSNYPEARNYLACLNASPEFSRSFANYLKPKWESIIKGYYESYHYEMFSKEHPNVNFGPENPSRPRSQIENLFVEGFQFPGRPPRVFETPKTDNYPTLLSASPPEKGKTAPSPQATPDSSQTDDTPQTTPQTLSPVQTEKVQFNFLAAQDLSSVSCLDSPQISSASGYSKSPPAAVARPTSAEHLMSLDHGRLPTSNMPGTIEQNDTSQSSPHGHSDQSSSHTSSQQPAQYSVSIDNIPTTTFYPSSMVLDPPVFIEPPSVPGALRRRSIANVDGAQRLTTLTFASAGLNNYSPGHSQGPDRPEPFTSVNDASPSAVGLYRSDTSMEVPSTCMAHEPFTEAYANPHSMYSHSLKDQAPPNLSPYQQNLLPTDGTSSVSPSESSFKHLPAPQPVTNESSGLSCLLCVLDTSVNESSTAFNNHAGQWHSHQGDNAIYQAETPIPRPIRSRVNESLYPPPPINDSTRPLPYNGTQIFREQVLEYQAGIPGGSSRYQESNVPTSMASLNPAEAYSSVAGFESSAQSLYPMLGNGPPGGMGLSPELSCNAEYGIHYLYKNGKTVSQVNSTHAQTDTQPLSPETQSWEEWSEGIGDIT